MALLIPGIQNLSQLNIDVDKDWLGFRIANLGAPAIAADSARRRTAMTEMPDLDLDDIILGQGAGADCIPSPKPTGADMPLKEQLNVLNRRAMPGSWVGFSSATPVATAGRIYYMPIFVSETTTYTGIGIDIGLGSAGTCDIRIFEWSGGLPGALRLSCGTVNTTAGGSKEIVINHQMTRGYYFLAARCSATPRPTGFDGAATSAITYATPGFTNLADGTILPAVLYVDAAYADPAPAPAGFVTASYYCLWLRET